MPSLFRFLRAVVILAVLVLAVTAGLAYLVRPGRETVRVPIPPERILEAAPAPAEAG